MRARSLDVPRARTVDLALEKPGDVPLEQYASTCAAGRRARAAFVMSFLQTEIIHRTPGDRRPRSLAATRTRSGRLIYQWTRVYRRSWHLADLPLSAGCPGVKGPVPQPVSMSCCSVNGSRSAGGRSTACDPRRTTVRFVHFYMVGAETSRLESAALSARDQVSASQATSAAARSPPTRAPP